MIEIIHEALKKVVDEGKIPGGTFAYVSLDSQEFEAYGYSQLEPFKKENNVDTLYDMASCSKVVATTTMILKLMEEGLINLEDKVNKHLPEFPHENITIKHLLTHTSGLPGDDKRYKQCKNKDEFVKFMYSLSLNNEPGSFVEYSDFGYITLGLIIEKYKGSIEDYANETIFKPLGMNNTMYNPILKNRKDDCACAEVTDARGVIQGEVHDGKAFILNGLSGNAGLFSNVKDLSKFVLMMLNNGYPILKKETIDLLKQCYTEKLNLPRTIGWMFNDLNTSCGDQISDVSLYHTGFSGTSIYIDYVNKISIILLTNRVHPNRNDTETILQLRKQIHNEILKKIKC